MKKVRITVMKMGCYPDLMAEYENPMRYGARAGVCGGQVEPAGGALSERVGEYVAVCVGAGQRRGESLCRVDEKSALGHDLLQRRLPARELSVGGNRRLTRLLY